jgi:DNA polymerase
MSNLTYVVADWETYYAPQLKYSLRVMDPPSYILDPRFEEIGCAFKINGGATHWIDGPDVKDYLYGLGDPRKIVMIAHNILFDASIASWRHGFVAGLYIDTLALSRALLGHVLARNDLATVARYLGLGEKGATVHKVANMTRQMIIGAGYYREYAAYSCQDADLCWGIFQKLASMMPADEIAIADMVARLAIEPSLKLDTTVLAEHLGQVKAEKDMLLQSAGLDMSTPAGKEHSIGLLMSNDKMASLLEGLGVEPPMKISPTTQEATYAFAKTDEAFKELLEHPDPAVQAIVAARMGHKSTLEETRTERFINISQLDFPAYGTGLFPVALKVSGAHTHRLSGDWRLNQQNLARPSRKRPRAMLRESIVAPEGKAIVAGDLSQIEARMAAVFCGQWDLVHEFDIGGDPYSSQASNVFNKAVTKALVGERFIGKTLVLSAGYGVGWRKYQASIRHLSGEILGSQIILSDEEAQRHINTYRRDKSAIVAMWQYLNDVVIPQMARPDCDFMLGPVRVMHERIVLPSGLCLHYRGLSRSPRTNDWYFIYGQRIKKLYGGKLLENIIQALARCVIMDAALRLSRLMPRYGGQLAMQVHDELVYLCPDENVGLVKALLELELKRRPTWMPDLPLNCEVGQGKAYGKAK